ncbi:unnamed protein product [Thelazia callipaeda]|uniref:DNA-directed RNA polymerase I subunit rpa49 n=1 Tax=Thelazia callipaeda TaxID=103827 RepID=A0A158RAS0_THECL|nr:unnamed protein product [Thelazia callipaeda]
MVHWKRTIDTAETSNNCSMISLDESSVPNTSVASKHSNIVARLTNNIAGNIQELVFQRHKVANSKRGYFYSAKTSHQSSKIVHLGQEENSEIEGCDYAIAVVNKRTGKAEFLPTKLICFENVPAHDFEALLNGPNKKIDYSIDNSILRESMAEKRRALITEFGSAKRNKAQEASLRRQIKDETLAVMMQSVFASTKTKEEPVEQKVEISMLAKPESSVLPKANMEAKSPQDVYTFSIFLSDAEISALQSEALQYLSKSRKELIEKGFSLLLCNFIGDLTVNPKRACYLLLLDAMIHCYRIVSKRRFLFEALFFKELQYPVTVLTKIREMFFPGEFVKDDTRSKPKIPINLMHKDRLLSHVLCLGIMLNHENMILPISPWAKELGAPELKITKLATALGCRQDMVIYNILIISSKAKCFHCSVSFATTSEGLRLGTTRVAKLVGPPQPPKKRYGRQSTARASKS